MIKSPCTDCSNKDFDKNRCYKKCKELHNEQMRDMITMSLSIVGADSIHAAVQSNYVNPGGDTK